MRTVCPSDANLKFLPARPVPGTAAGWSAPHRPARKGTARCQNTPYPTYDHDHCSTFSGHSLRAGHVTAAVKGGASEHSIQKQTGHRSVAMLRTYIRDAELFTDNSAARLGL
jgi:integrase